MRIVLCEIYLYVHIHIKCGIRTHILAFEHEKYPTFEKKSIFYHFHYRKPLKQSYMMFYAGLYIVTP